MKVRVKAEFKDKYTGKLHKIGDGLEMSAERINEVLKVGSFIELVAEHTEPERKEKEDTGKQAEKTMKQTGGQKGNTKEKEREDLTNE